MRAESGRATYVGVDDELVHPARTQRGRNDVRDAHAGRDVAEQLRNTLRGVGPVSKQHDGRLLEAQPGQRAH